MGNEFFKVFNKKDNILGLFISSFMSFFNIEWVLFAGYLVLNIVDYLTGTLKAKITKSESSSKGIIGIVKKLCYWILIGLAFFLSLLIANLGKRININLDFTVLFGWFTLGCLIINESRSIVENLISIGIYVPSFLKNGLEVYHKRIEKEINKIIDKNK